MAIWLIAIGVVLWWFGNRIVRKDKMRRLGITPRRNTWHHHRHHRHH